MHLVGAITLHPLLLLVDPLLDEGKCSILRVKPALVKVYVFFNENIANQNCADSGETPCLY